MEKNRDFAAKFDFPFPLLCDTTRALGVAYGAADDAGAASPRRVSTLIGADGRIEQVWDKVDAKGHPRQVLDVLG